MALNIELYGEQAPSSLGTMRMLGELYGTEDDNARAGEYFERQLAIARRAFPRDDPQLGFAEIAAGTFRKSQGEIAAGLKLLESGIDKLRPERETYAKTFIAAIISTGEQDGINDARALQQPLEEALAVAKSVYGPGSLYTANALLAIARNAVYLGDYERAKANYSVGLKIYDTQLGPQHASSISHMNNYGFMLMSIGDYAGAEKIHRELLGRLIESRGENHRLVADNYQNLASAILRQGRYDEALPLHRKAYEIYDKVLDEDHYIAVFPLLSIAYIELQRDNPAAAESAARTALETFKAAVPGTYLEGVATCFVGVALEHQGDTATGSAMVEASHALLKQQNLAGSPYGKLCRLPEE